jgi:hypothetical protein
MKNLLKTIVIVGGTIWAISFINKKCKENDLDLVEEIKNLLSKHF